MYDPLLYLLMAALAAGAGWFLFWPERGLFWRWQRTQQMTARVLWEDALKHLHKCERHHHPATVQSIAGELQIPLNQATDLLADMAAHELLHIEGQEIQLTSQGRDYALHVLRAHRLWERYLADETGFAEAEWHGQADVYEHTLSLDETEALAAQLGHPTYDPHGDPIPAASGQLVLPDSQPLTTLTTDEQARIVHLEDEPETIYAQLVAERLHPGQEIRLLEHSPRRVRFWAGGDEHVLAPVVAANISVKPIPQQPVIEECCAERLSSLKPGERAWVLNISPASRGLERRRFMDLGILPGTQIEAELTSPGGDPTAYRVRGTLIALRREQADMINITHGKTASTISTRQLEAIL
ncbi:MAG: DtxR family transcriptional regulator [Anaerolineae bacterium]|nr:DtxR family transcriptional regulator [Anaerolineae bacterium]